MRDSKPVRLFVIAAIAATIAMVPIQGSASAATPHIKCSKLTGFPLHGVDFLKCSGNTGESAMTVEYGFLATGGTITWANGETTTVSISLKQRGTDCARSQYQYWHTITITADTTGSTSIGSTSRSSTCVDRDSGSVKLVPGTKLKI